MFLYKSSKLPNIFVTVIVITLIIVYASTSTIMASGISNAGISDIVSDSPIVTQPPRNPIVNYEIDCFSESVLVVEKNRGMQLYIKNPDESFPIPLASKLMTAILAVELIPEDTMVTISSEASSMPDSSELSLNTGEKYSVEYLIYGLVLRDNDAAAIALAEQISGTEDEFVVQMNTRALSYQMNSTIYTNCTGNYDINQSTTVGDISKLLRFALAIPKLETVFKTHDKVFILSSKLTKHLISEGDDIWAIAEGTTGVFKSDSKAASSYAVTARIGQISVFIVGFTSKSASTLTDISAISSSIFDDYESSFLVTEGELFPQTMTVANQTFALRFDAAVNYIHPKSVDFIYDTIYEPIANLSLPLLPSNPVAKVTFELFDGTKITANLYPTTAVYEKYDFFRKILDVFGANNDVTDILLFLSSILVVTLLTKSFVYIFKSMKRKSS